MEENKKYRRAKSFIKYAVTVVTTVVVTLFVVSLSGGTGSEMYLKSLIKTYYVDDVDNDLLEQGAKAGMLAALGDRNTYYISPEVGLDQYNSEVTGEYGGIGILVAFDQEEELVSLVNVFPDTPAARCGMQQGDLIIAVNGEDVHGMAMDAVVSKTRGSIGEPVQITVKRGEEQIDFEMKREKINSVSVTGKVMDDNIGYVSINSFDMDTDEELRTTIEGLGSVDGLVIDLRNNPGGIMQVAVNAIDLFLDPGSTIVTAKYKHDNVQEFKDENEKVFSMPITVLVNENSASASEIFAAAIQDNGRGKIVGVNSYGKGTIQRTFKLPNNSGANITIGRFYSPNGNEINKVGVKPDVNAELKEEYKTTSLSLLTLEEDTQLQAALEQLR